MRVVAAGGKSSTVRPMAAVVGMVVAVVFDAVVGTLETKGYTEVVGIGRANIAATTASDPDGSRIDSFAAVADAGDTAAVVVIVVVGGGGVVGATPRRHRSRPGAAAVVVDDDSSGW